MITPGQLTLPLNTNTFGSRLRYVVAARGLALNELAPLVGVGHKGLSHWLNDRAKPDLAQFSALCQALEVDPGFLLGLESSPRPLALLPMEMEAWQWLSSGGRYSSQYFVQIAETLRPSAGAASPIVRHFVNVAELLSSYETRTKRAIACLLWMWTLNNWLTACLGHPVTRYRLLLLWR